MVRRTIGIVLGSLALVVALGACSDDGSDGDVALEEIDDGGSSSGSGSGSGVDDTAPDDTGDDDGSDSTIGAGLEAAGCEEFTDAFEALGASIGAGFDDVDPDALADMDELIEQAPEEIRDDLRVYNDAFARYAQALEDAGVDVNDPDSASPEAQAQLGELASIFTEEEFLDATTAINEFVAAGCEG